jgi:hypothetical protein
MPRDQTRTALAPSALADAPVAARRYTSPSQHGYRSARCLSQAMRIPVSHQATHTKACAAPSWLGPIGCLGDAIPMPQPNLDNKGPVDHDDALGNRWPGCHIGPSSGGTRGVSLAPLHLVVS